MKNTKIRWAILGAGKIARSFVKDFKEITDAELVAVASSDLQRAEIFAEENNIAASLTYSELFNSSDIDAVYIATTHNFHFEQCRQCLLHGKHVLCEKPITLNSTQFNELSSLAKSKNLFLMEAMWTWFLPPVIKAKQWIEQGRVGTIKIIDSSFGISVPVDLEGRMYNRDLAGGAILDLGVYPVAMATFILGSSPLSIHAAGKLTSTQVDERVAMVLQYPEVSAILSTSMVNLLANKAIFYGDEGYIEIPWFYKAKEATLYNNEQQVVDSFVDDRHTIGYNFEIQHATDCIRQGHLESSVVTHGLSAIVQDIMTEARRQIGVTYPEESAQQITLSGS